MIDFVPQLISVLAQGALRKPAFGWEPQEYRVLPLPFFHSEGFSMMGMPGYLLFHYVGVFGQGIKSGIVKVLWKKGWTWIAARQTLIMKKPIHLFRPLTIRSGFYSWNERFLVWRTEFYQRGELCGTNYVQGYILTRKGWLKIPTAEFLATLGDSQALGPELPADIKHWLA